MRVRGRLGRGSRRRIRVWRWCDRSATLALAWLLALPRRARRLLMRSRTCHCRSAERKNNNLKEGHLNNRVWTHSVRRDGFNERRSGRSMRCGLSGNVDGWRDGVAEQLRLPLRLRLLQSQLDLFVFVERSRSTTSLIDQLLQSLSALSFFPDKTTKPSKCKSTILPAWLQVNICTK